MGISKRKQTLKRRDRYFKASSGASGKKLINKGKTTVLKVVRLNLET